jgi:zinc/manganese transport system substrate-binding protein
MKTHIALLLVLLCPAWAQAAGGVQAIGIENEYADVIAQVGGRYVDVSAIETDPNTDPHSFEVSPRVVAQIAGARLIVENGLGYDDWSDRMIAAAPDAGRWVINVQHLRGLPDNTPNPHLWYDPSTMPAVAQAVAVALGALEPAHASYFTANARAFDASLRSLLSAVAAFRHDFPGVPVAVTEPVGDYLLQALGMNIMTPFTLQAAIMNGTDPSPQDVTTENALLNGRGARIFVYNQQVTDPLTQSFLAQARRAGVPVVGVYETMPAPGYNYQSWMLAEVSALRKAVAERKSTETLLPDTPH